MRQGGTPNAPMKIRIHCVLALLAMWLSGCARFTTSPPTTPTTQGSPTLSTSTIQVTTNGSKSLSPDTIKNAEYHSVDFGDYHLADGVYYRTPLPGESPDQSSTQLAEPIAFGDLNSDGFEDAVVILETRTGGTGVFVELAALLNQNGKADNSSTVSLGDRVKVNALRIQSGTIMLDMIVHGPNDGLCCPTQSEEWRFGLVDTQLIRQP